MGQVINLKAKKRVYKYSSRLKTNNNKLIFAKIFIKEEDFPNSMRIPFESLINKYQKLYPNDVFKRLRIYLKSICVPFTTMLPLLNGYGNFYYMSPFKNEQESCYFINKDGQFEIITDWIDTQPLFDGNFKLSSEVIP